MRAAAKARALSAALEFTLMVGATLGVDHFYGAGDRFIHLQPHPFWIAVLILTVQYGTTIGLTAALAASATLLVGNLPPFRGGIDLYDYLLTVLANPLMWVMAAALLGELRGRQTDEREGLKAALARTRREATDIALAYEQVKRAKLELELRIAAQPLTAVTLYEAARRLQRPSKAEVLEGLAGFLQIVMAAQAASLFVYRDDELVLAWSYGTATGAALYDGAVSAPASGKVYGRLRIYAIAPDCLDRPSQETFQVCCEWLGWALEQAELIENKAASAARRAA